MALAWWWRFCGTFDADAMDTGDVDSFGMAVVGIFTRLLLQMLLVQMLWTRFGVAVVDILSLLFLGTVDAQQHSSKVP